jgi:hypothetical protein
MQDNILNLQTRFCLRKMLCKFKYVHSQFAAHLEKKYSGHVNGHVNFIFSEPIFIIIFFGENVEVPEVLVCSLDWYFCLLPFLQH